MSTRVAPLVAGAALLVTVAITAGTEPLGRALMVMGLPRAALPFLQTDAARGAALFSAGEFAAAAEAFRSADDAYNHGLAAAWAGDYPEALVAWDRVLAANPNDTEARANHALIASLLAGTRFDPVKAPDPRDRDGPSLQAEPGQGKARASSTGDGANNRKTGFWMPEITGEGLRRVPKIFDAQFVAADERWLITLEDQPGRYLRARLAAEQKAREAAGTALPEPEDPR